jgi:hypothetical protein
MQLGPKITIGRNTQQDILGTVGGAAGATIGAMVGGPAGAVAGSMIGNSIVGGGGLSANSIFSMLGSNGLFATPQQAAAGGGQDGAYLAQLQASMQMADAARYTADQQLRLGQAQIDAQMQMANQSMIGGVISAAMAGQQDRTVRPERLPHEEGAIQIASMDFAMQHEKTMQMRIAGYSDIAIKHQMAGQSYKPLYRDAEWNTMQMMKMTKQDVMQNAQLFGFRSEGNPAGIAMSEEEYLGMMSMKDPNSLLQVDPAVAKARNAQYAAWKADQMANGNDLLVQLFENPQLSGTSILNMRGKEALIDPRLAPLLQQMNQVKEPFDDLDQQLSAYDAANKPRKKVMADGSVVFTDGKGQPFGTTAGQSVTQDQLSSGAPHKPTKTNLGPSFAYNEAMENYNAGRQQLITEYERKQHEYQQSLDNKFKWDDAINAMTKGENNKYTKQIEELQKMGVIDRATGRVNGDALLEIVPKDLLKAPPTEMYRKLSEQETNALKDEYKRLSEIKVDPKLVKVEQMGGGLTRKVLMNLDGTRSASVMEGYVTDATGQQRFMSMTGNRTQDFFDRASMISGFGPMGPAMAVTNTREAGTVSKRSQDNYMASFASGQKGKSASAAAPKAGAPISSTAAPALKMPSNPAASAGGAPLAAGDD